MTTKALPANPLEDLLDALHPNWVLVQGMRTACNYKSLAEENDQARRLAICDLSPLPRFVVKGPQAAGWLKQQAYPVPDGLFETTSLPGEGLIARTGGTEFFVEHGPDQAGLDHFQATGPGVYRVWRQDASMMLLGEQVIEVFAQTCGVNVRAEPLGKMFFSGVVGVSCSAVKRSFNGHSGVQLWCDTSYGHYLWSTLYGVVRDLNGSAVGLGTLFPNLAALARSAPSAAAGM